MTHTECKQIATELITYRAKTGGFGSASMMANAKTAVKGQLNAAKESAKLEALGAAKKVGESKSVQSIAGGLKMVTKNIFDEDDSNTKVLNRYLQVAYTEIANFMFAIFLLTIMYGLFGPEMDKKKKSDAGVAFRKALIFIVIIIIFYNVFKHFVAPNLASV